MAMFVGGLAQLLAGMWEVAVGNTFGATGQSRWCPHYVDTLPTPRSPLLGPVIQTSETLILPQRYVTRAPRNLVSWRSDPISL